MCAEYLLRWHLLTCWGINDGACDEYVNTYWRAYSVRQFEIGD